MSEQGLKQKTKKGLYWQFLDQASNYGVNFIIGIILARLLSPEHYGTIALTGVFMAVAGNFSGAGFGTAMIRKPELKEEDLATAFYYSTTIGVICYLILFCCSPFIADFYETPILTSIIRVSSLSFIYGPIGTSFWIIYKRRLDFKTPTKIGVICKLLSGIVGIAMAYWGYGVWALVVPNMIGGITGLILNWSVLRWYPKTKWSKSSFKYLWGFGNKLMASSLLDTLYNNIAPIFIGKFYSTNDLGLYNKAENFAKLPSQNLQLVLSSVTFPVLSKIQNDDGRLSYNYKRMLKVTAFIVFPLMMLLAGLSRPIILVLITAKWETSIILLQILCFSMMWWPMQSINLNLLLVKGRSDLFFRLEILKKIWGIFLLACTLPMGLIVFCFGNIISSYVSLAINSYYTGKLIDYGFFSQLRDLSVIFIISVFSFIISLGCTYIITDLFLQIFIGGILGAGAYIGLSWFFCKNEISDVKFLLHR